MNNIKSLQNMLYNQNYYLLDKAIIHKNKFLSFISNLHFYLSYAFVTQLQIKRNIKSHNINHIEINDTIRRLRE